jgi:hypothetical protein
MSDKRLGRILRSVVTKFRDERLYGILGRLNADGSRTNHNELRPGFVFVEMDNGTLSGNVRWLGDVALRQGMRVKILVKHDGEYILEGEDHRLMEGDALAPDNDYGIRPHPIEAHSDVTFTSEAANDLFAYNGTDWINSPRATVIQAAIDAATEQTAPEAANRFPLTDTGVLKWISYTNILAALSALYEAFGAVATHAALTVTHGATGAIVGTTNSQTLTDKTLTAPTIADFTNANHDHGDADDGGTLAGYAVAAQGVTNGNTHDHSGGDGNQIDHGGLGGLSDNDHTGYVLVNGANSANYMRYDATLGDVTTGQSVTILVEKAAIRARFVTKIYVALGRNANETIHSILDVKAHWQRINTGATVNTSEYTVTGIASTVTISVTATGLSVVLAPATAWGNTMDINAIVIESFGEGANLLTHTVNIA